MKSKQIYQCKKQIGPRRGEPRLGLARRVGVCSRVTLVVELDERKATRHARVVVLRQVDVAHLARGQTRVRSARKQAASGARAPQPPAARDPCAARASQAHLAILLELILHVLLAVSTPCAWA